MQRSYKEIFQASLLVAMSGILYGFLGFLGTGILRENISIPTMLFWRFLIAGGWILLFVIRKNSTQRLFNHIDMRTLLFMFFLGAIAYAGSSWFYFMASQYTGTGLAMVIFFSYPIIVALVSWKIHRQEFNAVKIVILVAMTIGLFLLQQSSTHPFNRMGIFFGILAAICYAIYVMGSKRISSIAINSNVLTTMVCFGCAFIFLMISISSHHFALPHSMKSWLYLLALGILATALPIQLMLEGLKYVSSMRASIISVVEPLVTVCVGVLLLDESVSHLQILGIFIILVSAVLVQFQREL
jgi:drug/metabolite transporter (DMT)-like permease